VEVAAVNDAPALTGAQVTLPDAAEDTAYTVWQDGLLQGFTDADGEWLYFTGVMVYTGLEV
jgi:hypothetical protein